MKLYKTTYLRRGSDTNTGVIFHSSAAEASKCRTALKQVDSSCKPVTTQVELFQTREGVLKFLNELFGEAAEEATEQA